MDNFLIKKKLNNSVKKHIYIHICFAAAASIAIYFLNLQAFYLHIHKSADFTV